MSHNLDRGVKTLKEHGNRTLDKVLETQMQRANVSKILNKISKIMLIKENRTEPDQRRKSTRMITTVMILLPAVTTSAALKQSFNKWESKETDIKETLKTFETQVHLQRELQLKLKWQTKLSTQSDQTATMQESFRCCHLSSNKLQTWLKK